MKTEEKGISLVVLVITIIVLLIIAGITLYQGTSIIRSTRLQSLKTDLLLIQAKVQIYSEQFNFEGDTSVLVGNPLVSDWNGLEPKITRKVLSQDNLKTMGLTINAEDNDYIVDYETNEVYYTKGYKKKDGSTVYSVTDIVGITAED